MSNNISNVINSRLRVTGMVSGLDTDMLVQQMMRIENMKVDRVKQQKQILEWRMEDYRSITNKLRVFQDKYFDILNPDTNMRSASAYNKYSVKSSNTDAVRAIGGAGLVGNEHTISDIKLATAATATSMSKITSEGNELNLSDKMSEVNTKLLDSGFSYGTVIINNIGIELNETDTLGSFISKVNNSKADVSIGYSQFHDKFTITSKKTGENSKIKLDSNGTNFFEKIGLQTDVDLSGTNATFTLDGVADVERQFNNFTIDGVSYTLLEETNEEITIKFTQDTDSIYDNIKSFIDDYNTLIEELNEKTSEKRDKNFLPLTDEQKESMKEEDIKKWEEKAKAGWLRNDGLLDNFTNQVRNAFYESVDGVHLSSIGITTGRWEDKGKLIINEQKFKKAIEDDPYTITNLFSKQSITHS